MRCRKPTVVSASTARSIVSRSTFVDVVSVRLVPSMRDKRVARSRLPLGRHGGKGGTFMSCDFKTAAVVGSRAEPRTRVLCPTFLLDAWVDNNGGEGETDAIVSGGAYP